MPNSDNLTEDEHRDILKTYLEDRSIYVEWIPELKNRMTPDLMLLKFPYLFIGELKAPELHINPVHGMYMHLTKVRKLREFMEKAVQQFESHDPTIQYPKILFLSSTHMQFHGRNLAEGIFAKVPGNNFQNDEVILRTNKDVRKIDLMIWLQISSSTKLPYQTTFAINGNSHFANQVSYLVKELRKNPASTMDQYFQY